MAPERQLEMVWRWGLASPVIAVLLVFGLERWHDWVLDPPSALPPRGREVTRSPGAL